MLSHLITDDTILFRISFAGARARAHTQVFHSYSRVGSFLLYAHPSLISSTYVWLQVFANCSSISIIISSQNPRLIPIFGTLRAEARVRTLILILEIARHEYLLNETKTSIFKQKLKLTPMNGNNGFRQDLAISISTHCMTMRWQQQKCVRIQQIMYSKSKIMGESFNVSVCRECPSRKAAEQTLVIKSHCTIYAWLCVA